MSGAYGIFLTNKPITSSREVVSYIFALIPVKNHLNTVPGERRRRTCPRRQLSLQILMPKKFPELSEGSINFQPTRRKVYRTVPHPDKTPRGPYRVAGGRGEKMQMPGNSDSAV